MQSQDEGLGYPTERGKNKNAWRMDIGQTPIQGQRHGYAILLQMGVRGARNERGDIIERMHKMMKKCRFLCEKVGFYEKCCNFDATK